MRGRWPAGSALSGLAPTLGLLIAARVVQGLGASLIFAPALALIVDAFPVSQRGQALGMNALVVSLGVTAGPTLGGLITESLGWRSIFFVNVPLGLVGLLVGRHVFTFGNGARTRRFDVSGAVLFGLGLASLSLGLSFGPEWGWTSTALVVTLALATASLGAAVKVERRHKDPLVDLDLLVSRRLGLPLASFLFSILALFAVPFLLRFYLEEMRGLTPFAAGLLLTPYSLGLAATSLISGRLSDRGQARWLGPLGLGLAASGLGLLALVGVDTPLLQIALWLALSGIGRGLFLSPNTGMVMSAVFIGLGGAAAGAALVAGRTSGSIAGPALDNTFLDALHAALLVCGSLAATGAVISLAGVSGYVPEAGSSVDARRTAE